VSITCSSIEYNLVIPYKWFRIFIFFSERFVKVGEVVDVILIFRLFIKTFIFLDKTLCPI